MGSWARHTAKPPCAVPALAREEALMHSVIVSYTLVSPTVTRSTSSTRHLDLTARGPRGATSVGTKVSHQAA